MNSRERVELALGHREPDRIPLDLGGSAVTGMHVSTVYQLRQALELDSPGTPVKGSDRLEADASAEFSHHNDCPARCRLRRRRAVIANTGMRA